ncbi:metallophosphoesterase family protein [Pedobacter insulae]|uniref:Calcineurin-like phosphoesterase n=1 Tax=Pedobacter insulae TaxID=414048 RepID=A0A1I2VGQ7_9SPHI|nr:metallophosphoesterase [Pedobacter insulae]SFG88504.1 Calcineurin-like phosphoesterase [Pedobacter insulae]
MLNIKYVILFIFIFSLGCNSTEYSPNQKFNRNTPTNVNAKEIATLPNKAAGSTVKIAVSGDTQRSYKQSQDFVDLINARDDIDFIILNGDISDFGLLLEFNGIYEIYSKLKKPFISVIGNHDLVANGADVYKHMFGDLNFTFNYAGIKFICHDTNGREYDFNGSTPNMAWLKSNLKLEAGTDRMIAFSHVPPFDGDFDPKLVVPYEDLLNQTPGMLASIHSHQHQPGVVLKSETGIPFIITNAIVKRAFTLITITNAQIDAQEINF